MATLQLAEEIGMALLVCFVGPDSTVFVFGLKQRYWGQMMLVSEMGLDRLSTKTFSPPVVLVSRRTAFVAACLDIISSRTERTYDGHLSNLVVSYPILLRPSLLSQPLKTVELVKVVTKHMCSAAIGV